MSGYIGSSTSDRSGSVDNQSTVSSGNASENGDSKRSSSIASEGEKPAAKHCPICKKAFTKVYLKFRYYVSILSSVSKKNYWAINAS